MKLQKTERAQTIFGTGTGAGKQERDQLPHGPCRSSLSSHEVSEVVECGTRS